MAATARWGCSGLPFFDSDPFVRHSELAQQQRDLIHQGPWPANETERRRILDERRERITPDPAPWSHPSGVVAFARDRLPQIDRSLVRHRAQLGFVGEISGRACAVEQADPAVRDVEGVTEHRPERRNPGAAGDEREAIRGWSVGEDKSANGTLDINGCAN